MNVFVNGDPEELPDGATVGALVEKFKLTPKRVAVEVNREIVPRTNYDDTPLQEGDRVEVVTFVGGG